MPRALDAELHVTRQELPSHSRLPVCRPRDWALACRQSRLLCAWPASFGERLVHSMQSFTPGPLPPPPPACVLIWLGVADRVRFWLSDADRVWLGYADRVWIGYADRVWLSNADRVWLGYRPCLAQQC